MQTNNIELIFKQIIEHDNKNRQKVELYKTDYEKYTLVVSIVSFFLTLIIAISSNSLNEYFSLEVLKVLKMISILLLMLSLLSAMIYSSINIYSGIKSFQGLNRTFFNPITKFSVENYEFSHSLIHFTKEELLYVSKRLSLEIEQMKKRVSMLIGLIDKIGIIPAIVSLSLVISKNIEVVETLYNKFDWLAYAIVGIYIIGIIALSFIHKIERYILILDTAINLKENTE